MDGPTIVTASHRARCLLVILLAVAALARPPAAHAQAPGAPGLDCPGNRLVNPGFEAGFSARGRLAEVVGNGWTLWYATLPGVGGLNYPPAYSPARRGRSAVEAVHSGLWSQTLATEDATHTGGLWQQVPVPPGARVMAWVWANAWATDGEDPARSEPPGTYALQLGVDPAGGTDPNGTGIVWTEAITVTDTWLPLALELPVTGPTATLFLRGQPREILRHNLSRWDSACLRVIDPAGVLEEEAPPPDRPTRVPPTLAPGEPTPTPNLATIEAELALQSRATERAVLLQIKVATRAAAAAAPVGPEGQAGGGAPGVMLGMPEDDETSAPGDSGSSGNSSNSGDPYLDEPAPALPLGIVIADHAGLLALTVAAFAGGVLLGYGREKTK